MSQTQFAQALWSLARGEALSLDIGPGPRELSVTEGRLWLTRQGSASQAAEDIWLEPGQSVQLRSGSRVVVEGWPQASFQLLVPPAACPQMATRLRAAAASAAGFRSAPSHSSSPSPSGLAAA
ncbi:DUF2917 domain-containing protein [Roseateles sp. DAIF2]|uniref:DUF2917 domain-containing protein n=1 Tax=Roseateles sp. DAIF2 TaxID=2714952 RepID=UPI0018A26DF6|nr:DUF2917 domain-containing protein [Roseateles sp. DAIF2]QPF72319.1 DUF2917 domain-containing protein [Roseateles sp. DAIF2]